ALYRPKRLHAMAVGLAPWPGTIHVWKRHQGWRLGPALPSRAEFPGLPEVPPEAQFGCGNHAPLDERGLAGRHRFQAAPQTRVGCTTGKVSGRCERERVINQGI